MADPISYPTKYVDTIKIFEDREEIYNLYTPYKDWTEFSNSKNAAFLSYYLAHYGFNARFTEAEHIIKTDAPTAVYYAKHLIGGRWPEAEAEIATDAMAAADYAVEVLKTAWKTAEATIFTVPIAAHYYVKEIIKKKHVPAENIIKSHPNTCYRYTNEVLKVPWPIGETALLGFSHPFLSVLYAKDCVKGRWIAAENIIKANPRAKAKYLKLFPDANLDVAEIRAIP